MSAREIQYGNAIIKIHRPTLTEKERNEQENKLAVALQLFGKEMHKKGKIK